MSTLVCVSKVPYVGCVSNGWPPPMVAFGNTGTGLVSLCLVSVSVYLPSLASHLRPDVGLTSRTPNRCWSLESRPIPASPSTASTAASALVASGLTKLVSS